MGYSPRELYPVPKKALYVKGFDNKETLQMKYENFEEKRKSKIEECQREYGVCKEFCKYADLKAYIITPIKKHWEPEGGDPSGNKKKRNKGPK